MAQTNGTRRIKIAICGGGIAGVCVARGLAKYPHIDAHLYEAGPLFTERGAGVGLSVNATRALSMIHPDLRKALDLAGAVPMRPSYRIMMATGPSAGEFVTEQDAEDPQLILHRVELLEELVKTVPEEMLHVNKKAVRFDEGIDGVTVHFQDDSTILVDAVIGSDGIHSRVRKHILGDDHPAAEPFFAHCYAHANVVPIERAREVFGNELAELKCQTGWHGQDGFLMTDLVSDAKSMQVVAAVYQKEPWQYESWAVPTNEEEISRAFAGWGQIGKDIAGLLAENPNIVKWAMMEHHDAPTFTRGNICIVGDAAHAFTPWMGSGAGQAIEDALVMERILGVTLTPADIPAAFQAFDKIRRPRSTKIAAMSREQGDIAMGRNSNVGVDLEKTRAVLEGRWDYIWYIDLTKHVEDAMSIMKKLASERSQVLES